MRNPHRHQKVKPKAEPPPIYNTTPHYYKIYTKSGFSPSVRSKNLSTDELALCQQIPQLFDDSNALLILQRHICRVGSDFLLFGILSLIMPPDVDLDKCSHAFTHHNCNLGRNILRSILSLESVRADNVSNTGEQLFFFFFFFFFCYLTRRGSIRDIPICDQIQGCNGRFLRITGNIGGD